MNYGFEADRAWLVNAFKENAEAKRQNQKHELFKPQSHLVAVVHWSCRVISLLYLIKPE